MKKPVSYVIIIIGLIMVSMLALTGCGEPEVIIKTVVETVEKVIVETVTETVTVTVVETVEVEKENGEKTTEKVGPVPKGEDTDSIILNGSGDSVIDFDKPDTPMAAHIVGNPSSRYFSVTSYDKEGEYMALLVSTTEPYDGIRPLDFMPGELTSRFEIESVDDWTIEILPVSSLRVFSVPGKMEGTGDEVIKISGEVPDLAKISGNEAGSYFGIFTYNSFKDLIVNETEPYEGTVMLESEITFIEVVAEGDWSIEITAK